MMTINSQFCAHDRLNGPSDSQRSEVNDETSFRYVHAEIQTQVVVICGQMRYQLDHGDAHWALRRRWQSCLRLE